MLQDGRVSTKRLARHRGRAHKMAIEPSSSRIFYSCGEDGVVQHVSLASYLLPFMPRNKRSECSNFQFIFKSVNMLLSCLFISWIKDMVF